MLVATSANRSGYVCPRELDYLSSCVGADVPVFGICFGAQLLARALGGSVAPAAVPEVGFIDIDVDASSALPAGPWLSSHYDAITAAPSSRVVARTAHAVQAYLDGPHLGVQFHPEADLGVLRAWQQRREAKVDDGGGSLSSWLDVDATAALLQTRSSRRQSACDRVLDVLLRSRRAAVSVGSERDD